MKKFFITEGEKTEISNKHEEIDRKILNFLLRRGNVTEKQIGDDEHPIKFSEVRFEGLPGFGFSTFNNRKDMEKSIIEMLEEKEVINLGEFNPNVLDTDRQKIIKTIRYFLNFILPKK
jgi:hypothetical protein